MAGLTFKVDTREFSNTLRKYMQVTSRSMPEAVNQHAYYIARNAVVDTIAVPREEIDKQLRQTAREYPDVPLAAILVNAERGANGKKGLNGNRMRIAAETFIRKRERTRNFLRSGWLPAVKYLEKLVKNKRGKEPLPSGLKKSKGTPLGGARAARVSYSFKPIAEIWNSVFGGRKSSPRVKLILQRGAQKALNREVQSMKEYIEKKLNQNAQQVGWK